MATCECLSDLSGHLPKPLARIVYAYGHGGGRLPDALAVVDENIGIYIFKYAYSDRYFGYWISQDAIDIAGPDITSLNMWSADGSLVTVLDQRQLSNQKIMIKIDNLYDHHDNLLDYLSGNIIEPTAEMRNIMRLLNLYMQKEPGINLNVFMREESLMLLARPSAT